MKAACAADDGLGVVRVKPLGVGGGGVERSAQEGLSSIEYSLDTNSVRVNDKHSSAFDYPSKVVGPDSSQQQLYDGYMPRRIEGFLQGLNCNIMAYGQTGTGKTHTMFGPPGLMARAGRGEFGMEVIPEYGLFPRGLTELYTRLQTLRNSAPGVRYVMTVSAVELALEGNLDMFVKSESSGRNSSAYSEFGASDPGANGVSLDRTCSPPRASKDAAGRRKVSSRERALSRLGT